MCFHYKDLENKLGLSLMGAERLSDTGTGHVDLDKRAVIGRLYNRKSASSRIVIHSSLRRVWFIWLCDGQSSNRPVYLTLPSETISSGRLSDGQSIERSVGSLHDAQLTG